jgi:hypothetical protein
MKTFLILFFLSSVFSVKAQGDKWPWVDGYIVPKVGDTIKGQMKLFNEYRSCRTVHFKYPNDSIKKLGPFEIIAFSRNGEIYEKKRIYFMKRLAYGKISLYQLNYRQVTIITPESMILGMYSKNTAFHLFKEGATNTKCINKANFRGVMKRWTKDNESLSSQIRMKEYRFENLLEVINIYNQ